MSRLILNGATLIDGAGGTPVLDSTVLVENGRIVRAGPRLTGFSDAAFEPWDLTGKTIIPGLIDAHTHSTADAEMLAYVKNGVTTIRIAGLDLDAVARVRQRISERVVP